MLKSIKIILPFFLVMAAASFARIIKVPADQPTIQSGINAAENGDTVLVYPGTYFENVNFHAKRIVITSRFYESGDLSFIQSTIINGSRPVNPDTSSCVLIISGEDSTAVLQGFTITGGKGTKWRDEHGAGLYREGGGILIAKSSPTVRFNVIMNNEAANTSGVTSAGGGGIRAGDGNPKILNNIVTSNIGRYGAGIVLNFTGAVVRNNIITKNSGGQDYGGGALWMNHDGASQKIIENNTITANKVVGIYVYQGSSIIKNCIIWADPPTSAVQIVVRTGGPTVSYSNVLGGYSGSGNIFSDPQFADSTLTLKDKSPCIDAGDKSIEYNDVENSLAPGNALFPSRGSLSNDMGTYGGPGAAKLPNFNLPTSVRLNVSSLPAEYRLYQNYPNPFNPSTAISYQLLAFSHVTIKVYNLLGSEITTLVNEDKPAGKYSVQFNSQQTINCRQLSSGVYFYSMQVRASNTGKQPQSSSAVFVETKKFILLK